MSLIKAIHLYVLQIVFKISLFQHTPKQISMIGAEIAQSNIDHKQNAFHIKAKNSKRVYYLHADTEECLHNWMQAICFAKAAGRTGGQSEACVVQ